MPSSARHFTCSRRESVKCRNRRPENVHPACAHESRSHACTTRTNCMIAHQDLEIVIGRWPDLIMLRLAISTEPGMSMFKGEQALSEQILMTHSRQRAIVEHLFAMRLKGNRSFRHLSRTLSRGWSQVQHSSYNC